MLIWRNLCSSAHGEGYLLRADVMKSPCILVYYSFKYSLLFIWPEGYQMKQSR